MEEKKLLETLNKPVACVDQHERGTTITFVDGTKLELDGKPVRLEENIPACNFCGAPADDDPLYSVDGTSFICKRCVALAFETLLLNGVSMPINAKLSSFLSQGHE